MPEAYHKVYAPILRTAMVKHYVVFSINTGIGVVILMELIAVLRRIWGN